jgi:RDD family
LRAYDRLLGSARVKLCAAVHANAGGYPPPVGAQEPGGLLLRFAARMIDGIIVAVVIVPLLDALTNIWLTGLFTGPTAQQSAIRNVWTLLPIIPFIGGLLAFIAIVVIAVAINSSPTKQGKHDELAGGTQVVKG